MDRFLSHLIYWLLPRVLYLIKNSFRSARVLNSLHTYYEVTPIAYLGADIYHQLYHLGKNIGIFSDLVRLSYILALMFCRH